MRVWSRGWKDPLKKETATHSSIFAWKIPRTEETGRLQSVGSQGVGHNWSNLAQHNIQQGRDSFFNKCCWENWTATCKSIKLDYSLIPCTKINSKWIKHLNITTETFIKLREENTTNIFFDINSSNNFSDISPPIRETKVKINEITSN